MMTEVTNVRFLKLIDITGERLVEDVVEEDAVCHDFETVAVGGSSIGD